jgi:hypothetical protein
MYAILNERRRSLFVGGKPILIYEIISGKAPFQI